MTHIALTRRSTIALLAASAAGTLHAAPDGGYPSKPIRQIVPWPAGGGTDAAARIVGERIGARLRQPVPTENRSGASGFIGADAVLNAPADGYTILTTIVGSLAAGPSLFKSEAVARSRSLTPVAMIGAVPNAVIVAAQSPIRSLQELVSATKTSPGRYTFASSGNGGSMHLAAALFCTQAGIELAHVPYKGGAPAVVDVAAGMVDVAFPTIPSALPLIQSGKVRALGVTGATRSPLLPDVPTVQQSGIPDYVFNDYYAIFTTPNVLASVVGVLAAAVAAALGEKQVQDRLTGLGIVAYEGTETLRQLLTTETMKWSKVLKAAGVQPE